MTVDIIVSVCAVLAGVIGVVGSIVPALPGPFISWVGLLILYIWGSGICFGNDISLCAVIVCGVLVLLVTLFDYVVPSLLIKKTGGSNASSWGAFIGVFLGMFYGWLGLLLGPFLGAFIGELMFTTKRIGNVAKAAAGSLLGFVVGTGVKLILTLAILLLIIIYL